MKIIEVDRSKLLPSTTTRNCSILVHKNKTILAYVHEENHEKISARIAICELDNNYQPIKHTNRFVNVPPPKEGLRTNEDPRLFEHDGDLYMSCSPGGAGGFPTQALVKLDDNYNVVSTVYPNWGGNVSTSGQKNWTFFSHNGLIHIIFTIEPLVILRIENNGEVNQVSKISSEFGWKWGYVSGGSTVVKDGNKLIGAFHSWTRSDLSRSDGRDYFIGFYEIDIEKWKLTKISKDPFMSAAKDDSRELRTVENWRPNVIFPCGLIKSSEVGYDYIMSYGWQDSRCELAFIKKEKIEENLRPVEDYYFEKEVLFDPYQSIPGGFNCTINGIQFKATTWNRLKIAAIPHGFTEDDLHKAICPRLESRFKKSIWSKSLKKNDINNPYPLDKIFCSSGDIGDIIASLIAVKNMGGGSYYLVDRPVTKQWNQSRLDSTISLLESQDYIKRCIYQEPPFTDGCDFSKFRSSRRWRGNSLAHWHSEFAGLYDVNYNEPWLKIDSEYNGKIVVCRTFRWRGSPKFPWKKLVKEFKNDMIFLGYEDECMDFVRNFGSVEYVKTNNLLESAKIINGCKLLISNQTSLWWIGEALKKNAILEKRESRPLDDSEIVRDNAIHIYDQNISIEDVYSLMNKI